MSTAEGSSPPFFSDENKFNGTNWVVWSKFIHIATQMKGIFGCLDRAIKCQSCEQWTGLCYIFFLVLLSFSYFILFYLEFLFLFFILDLGGRSSHIHDHHDNYAFSTRFQLDFTNCVTDKSHRDGRFSRTTSCFQLWGERTNSLT